MEDMFSLFNLRETKKHLKLSKPKFAYAIYKDYRVDLLQNKRLRGGSSFLLTTLDSFKITDSVEKPFVAHLYYELGYLFENLGYIEKDSLLAIVIQYQAAEMVSIKNKKSLRFKQVDDVALDSYSKQFDEVQENLEKGNCYQLNLTRSFKFDFSNYKVKDFIDSLFSKDESLSPYAHASYIPLWDKLILSNSPECLFTLKGTRIASMPIKGTVKESDQAWSELLNSKKDQGELYMISDLIRNDLTRIAMTPSVVEKKKAKLRVPKIWHQYSLITNELPKTTSILDIVQNTFPGGSITGAPKKRAMDLLQKIEGIERGVYCGSTLVLHKSLKAASINIRTADVDLKNAHFHYGSGGGVTLLSKTNDEYEEMLLKLKSFLSILN